MKPPQDQIALPLDWPQAPDEDRFLVSAANRAAYDHFRQWSLWPVRATILVGPRRSGRSLLGRTFCGRVDGRLVDRAEAYDEEELFHAWNAAQDSGRPLVMIADAPFEPALPDLRTRLAVTPVVRIEEPDDALFKGIIQLLFADRGVHVPDEVLDYLGNRVERSYWSAERIVEVIDRFAIAERARLTIPTVRRALAEGGLIDHRGAA